MNASMRVLEGFSRELLHPPTLDGRYIQHGNDYVHIDPGIATKKQKNNQEKTQIAP